MILRIGCEAICVTMSVQRDEKAMGIIDLVKKNPKSICIVAESQPPSISSKSGV
jgi:hypothetical protein